MISQPPFHEPALIRVTSLSSTPKSTPPGFVSVDSTSTSSPTRMVTRRVSSS